MKFVVTKNELCIGAVASEPIKDGVRITVSALFHFAVEQVPDGYGGPRIEVVHRNPLIVAVHDDAARGRAT